MYEANEPTSSDTGRSWPSVPAMKDRMAVQQAATRLLDALAPERAVSRAVREPAAIERHRTPRGCILQGEGGALSVTWFPEAAAEGDLGELMIVAWRGTVSLPGSATRVKGAVAVRELVLQPVLSADGWSWRDADGTVRDTAALTERCLALLAEQTCGTAVGAG